MTTTNRMNRRTITGIPDTGSLVIGVGLEGVFNGGDSIGMTFDLSQIILGVNFTALYEIRKTQDGAWGLEGSDVLASGLTHTVDLSDLVGYEIRVTLSHAPAGPALYDVPVECVIEQ